MSVELFGKISENYDNASKNLWYWHRYKNVLIKIVTIPWILLSSIAMKAISIFFSMGIIFDKLSIWLEKQRHHVISSLESSNRNLQWNKIAYITSPLKAALLAPIALFLGIFPKWSSTIMAVGTGDGFSHGTEHGFFTQLGKHYLVLVKNMFSYAFSHGFFFGLIAIVLSTIVAPVALIISAIFFILIILDLLSWLVELIREFIVVSSAYLARNVGNNFISTVFFPVVLTLLVPVYVVLILIPKISSQTEA
jgi:hypothetical protein